MRSRFSGLKSALKCASGTQSHGSVTLTILRTWYLITNCSTPKIESKVEVAAEVHTKLEVESENTEADEETEAQLKQKVKGDNTFLSRFLVWNLLFIWVSFVCLFTCLSFCLSICLSVRLSNHWFICFFHLSCLSVRGCQSSHHSELLSMLTYHV